MVRMYITILILLFNMSLHAEVSGKAIMDANAEKGIMLSDEAKKNIGFKTIVLEGAGVNIIPKSSLVYSRDKVGVYRFQNNWLKFIPVKISSKNNNLSVEVTSSELSSGTVIVVEGAALVRVSEMEAFAGGE